MPLSFLRVTSKITSLESFASLNKSAGLLLALVILFALCSVSVGESTQNLVTIYADGRQVVMSAQADTVAEVLSEAGIVLGMLDRVQPQLNDPLPPNQEIRVTRIQKITLQTIVDEPQEKKILIDPDMRPGIVVELVKGQDGRVCQETLVWLKDGVETKRTTTNTTRIQERIDTIEIHGTAALASRGATIRHCMEMEATAYEPGPISCGKFADGYTSIGLKATKGIAAVDPRVIPMRTRLYVEGYGFAIAGDVGSAIKGNRIDLCFDTYREAIQFGRRNVKVYLLD